MFLFKERRCKKTKSLQQTKEKREYKTENKNLSISLINHKSHDRF